MRPLRLLEQFADVILRARVQAFGLEQLRVAQDRGQRIVQFVRDAGNQLADGRHLFALQQLFLRLAQIFVSAAGFFVEADLFDGGGQLPADGDQQVLVVAGIFVSRGCTAP